MRRLYSNPNAPRRTLLAGGRLHYFKPGEVKTGEEIEALEVAKLKRAKHQPAKDRRFNKGHMLNVRKYMPYIRRCRAKCQPPRRVPRKVLETVVALCLK